MSGLFRIAPVLPMAALALTALLGGCFVYPAYPGYGYYGGGYYGGGYYGGGLAAAAVVTFGGGDGWHEGGWHHHD